MYLDKVQKRLLYLLQAYGGVLRQSQILPLLHYDFDRVGLSSIQQLISMGVLLQDGDLVYTRRKISKKYLDAIDTMLQLSPNSVQHHQPGTAPVLLTFFKNREDQLTRYDICPVRPGGEDIINAMFESTNRKHRVIVYLLTNSEQLSALRTGPDDCFALRTDSGNYKFFKGKRG